MTEQEMKEKDNKIQNLEMTMRSLMAQFEVSREMYNESLNSLLAIRTNLKLTQKQLQEQAQNYDKLKKEHDKLQKEHADLKLSIEAPIEQSKEPVAA